MDLTLTTTLTPEQALSLREGMRHRAAYYGWPVTREGEGEALTVALAWWCAWWRDRRRQADVRGADMETGELFAAPVCIGNANTDDARVDGGAGCDPGRAASFVRPPFAASVRFYAFDRHPRLARTPAKRGTLETATTKGGSSMSDLQKRRAGRGRLRPVEDTAGNHKGRRGGSRLVTPGPVEEPLGACSSKDAGVRRWWRTCARDWPQLSRRDRIHLHEYCRLRVRIEELTRRIDAEGEVVETRNGPKLHPLASHLRASEKRADGMVRDFAGCAGTRERARPLARQDVAKATVLTLLEKGKPA